MFYKVSGRRSQKSVQTMKVLAFAKRVETQLDKQPDQGVFPAGLPELGLDILAQSLTADLCVADADSDSSGFYLLGGPTLLV